MSVSFLYIGNRSHQFPDKAPSRMAEAQKPSCSKRKTAKQRSSEHRTLCNIFSPYHSSVWGQISIGEITDSPSRYPMRHILFLFKKTAAKWFAFCGCFLKILFTSQDKLYHVFSVSTRFCKNLHTESFTHWPASAFSVSCCSCRSLSSCWIFSFRLY